MNRRTVLRLGMGMAAALGGGGGRRGFAQAPPFATRKISDPVYIGVVRQVRVKVVRKEGRRGQAPLRTKKTG